MSCKKETRLKRIVDVLVKGELYSKNLRKKEFDAFLDILHNAQRKKFSHCFTKKTQKLLRAQKSVIKILTNKKKSRTVRMKKLRNVSKGVRRVFRQMIKNFLSNCVECKPEENANNIRERAPIETNTGE